MRVDVQPELLRWARLRAGVDVDALTHKFAKYGEWEAGELNPTMKQLEKFAKTTSTPVGFFFLPEPPEESLPVPDFRTIRNEQLHSPSPDLLEMLYICQQRQEWYRDYCRANGYERLAFVGSASLDTPVVEVAEHIRLTLGFDLQARRHCRTWEEALRLFVSDADAIGIMVMCSGVVLNNNYRKLNPEEFRGFALVDEIAPLIFVNGGDTKAAQMFTLAHELAHLWLARSGVSSVAIDSAEEQRVEQWCNSVAAEILVPLAILESELDPDEATDATVARLSRHFKVSTLVVLRRLLDAGLLTGIEFRQKFDEEKERLADIIRNRRSGGDFYLSQGARLSKRFARAVVESALEGNTLYRDAMQMVGVRKVSTFHKLGRSLNVPI